MIMNKLKAIEASSIKSRRMVTSSKERENTIIIPNSHNLGYYFYNLYEELILLITMI